MVKMILRSRSPSRLLLRASFVRRRSFRQRCDSLHGRVPLKLDLKPGLTEERAVFIHQARSRQLAIVRIEFHADAVSPVLDRGHHGRGGAAEWIEHGVAGE